MSYTAINLDESDGLATLTLNRPEVLNSMNKPMLRELLEVTNRLKNDGSIRAVMLTGNGRGFCAGADLAETTGIAESPGERGVRVQQLMRDYYNPIALNLSTMKKPVVCAVNGVAAGGGVGLALCCDVVFAAESASFVQVFVPQLGIIPDVGSTWFLPRLLGPARAMGLMLTGEKLSARRAAEWGLIWQCCEDTELVLQASAFAAKLAQGPTTGIAWTKKALQLSQHHDLDQQLAFEAEAQRTCCASDDATEGFAAFLEKRKPVFSGR